MGIGSGSSVNKSGEYILGDILRRLGTEPLTVFDVGANQGKFTTMIFSQLANRNLVIHAFEPSAIAFAALRRHIPQQDNIILNQIGLGREEREALLYSDHLGSSLASLTRRNMAHEKKSFDKSETVKITTLDTYCSNHNINSIDLLKMDVEGHEMDVIHGAKSMFRKNAIRMISFEFGAPDIDTRTFFRDFFYFFKNKGMEIYRITRSGYLCHIAEYHEKHEQFRTTNFLVVNPNYSIAKPNSDISKK